MAIGSKWWLMLFLLWVGVNIYCLAAEGSFPGASQANELNTLASQPPVVATINFVWGFMKTAFTWNYAVLNNTQVGHYIKMILLCVSMAVFIPVGYEIIRYFNPFKS